MSPNNDNELLSATFGLGEFIIDPNALEISKRGESTRKIQPIIMELLKVLVELRKEVVSRKVLIEAIWSESFINEEALTKHISKLRQILSDDPNNPKYIETIPKVGYRLIAEVYSLDIDLNVEKANDKRGSDLKLTTQKQIKWLWGAVATLLFLILGQWFFESRLSDQKSEYFTRWSKPIITQDSSGMKLPPKGIVHFAPKKDSLNNESAGLKLRRVKK